MTDKVDFKKTLDAYQAKQNQFRIVDVPAMQYLMIDGLEDPYTSQDYVNAMFFRLQGNRHGWKDRQWQAINTD